MDKDHLILTAIGPDQVGIVEKISEFTSKRGCNIEDSKMAVFCGEFAIIMLISGAPGNLVRIGKDYRDIEAATGLAIAIKAPAARRAGEFLACRLTASCMDHPGIVYQISGVLSALGVNIESLETKTYSAPESGSPLFRLEARLAVPSKTILEQLRTRFADLQNEQNIDIEIEAAV